MTQKTESGICCSCGAEIHEIFPHNHDQPQFSKFADGVPRFFCNRCVNAGGGYLKPPQTEWDFNDPEALYRHAAEIKESLSHALAAATACCNRLGEARTNPSANDEGAIDRYIANFGERISEARFVSDRLIRGRHEAEHARAMAENPHNEIGKSLHHLFYYKGSSLEEAQTSIQAFLEARVAPVVGHSFDVKHLCKPVFGSMLITPLGGAVKNGRPAESANMPSVVLSPGNTLCFYSGGRLMERRGNVGASADKKTVDAAA